MMDVRELIPRLHEALTRERETPDVGRIWFAMDQSDIVGVHGEPEVGVTSVIEAAIRQRGLATVRLDLDGVAGEPDLVWLLARGVAAVVVSRPDLSLLAAPPALQPATARQALSELQALMGMQLADIAVSTSPPPGDGPRLSDALDVLGTLAAQRPLQLWVDHLDTPSLTSRHPVDVKQLLWAIRAVQQVAPLHVLLSGHKTATDLAAGRSAAFHGDGVWVTLGRPGVTTWLAVARELSPTPARSWVEDMWKLTDGHPATMLAALAHHALMPDAAHTAEERFRLMASLDNGHVGRAVQHARSLHRLGGHVLEQVASGGGPYQETHGATVQDIHRAIRRLHAAGLITQPLPRTWALTNPLVAAGLRGTVRPVIDPAHSAALQPLVGGSSL